MLKYYLLTCSLCILWCPPDWQVYEPSSPKENSLFRCIAASGGRCSVFVLMWIFSYIHRLSCCWEYPQMLQGKNLLQAVPFAAKDQGTLPSLSKKCFLSSSQRMTVDVTQRTFKLEKWIEWRKQTFGESLRSLKLEIILGWIKREEAVYTWYVMYFYNREDELITTSPDSHL